MKILGTIVTFNKVLRNNFWYYPPTKIAKNKPVHTCLSPLSFVVASENVSGTLLRRIILTIVAASQLAISTVAPVGRFAPACGGHQGLLKRMGYTTFFESPAPQESISKELYFHSRDHKGLRAFKAVSLRSQGKSLRSQ